MALSIDCGSSAIDDQATTQIASHIQRCVRCRQTHNIAIRLNVRRTRAVDRQTALKLAKITQNT